MMQLRDGCEQIFNSSTRFFCKSRVYEKQMMKILQSIILTAIFVFQASIGYFCDITEF